MKDTTDTLSPSSTRKFPVLFAGHGSPMNILDLNIYTRALQTLTSRFPGKPNAVVCISAHWITRGTFILADKQPKQIYDFHGFPEELYKIKYEPPGDPALAESLLSRNIQRAPENQWGLDHGSWAILRHLYPDQDVPVLQMSIDQQLSISEHYQLATELCGLREQGVLILGSGNLVHNLRQLQWDTEAPAYPWANDFEAHCLSQLTNPNLSPEEKVISIFQSPLLKQAHPSVDHLLPLIYCLGAIDPSDSVEILSRGIQNASVSMATILFLSNQK